MLTIKGHTLCQELGITRQTLYRHISPDGQLRADGIKLLTVDNLNGRKNLGFRRGTPIHGHLIYHIISAAASETLHTPSVAVPDVLSHDR